MAQLPCIKQYVLGKRLKTTIIMTYNLPDTLSMTVSLLAYAPIYTCNNCDFVFLSSSMYLGDMV